MQAFVEFIQNFRSVEHSRREQKRKERAERAARGDSELNHDDSDSDLDLDDDDDELAGAEPFYMNELQTINRTQSGALNLDCIHLYYHSPSSRRLYHWLVDYPQEIVIRMDEMINQIYHHVFSGTSDFNEDHRIQVRPFHFRTVSHMRALDPSSIDSMVTLQGMVLRASPVIPDLKVAHFKCCVCGSLKESTIDRGRIDEPTTCDDGGCGSRHSFEIIHNRSTFTDKQLVRLQETPDEVPAGETPASVTLFAYDDIVDSVRPGDRVEVTGVFRAIPKRPNPKRTVVRSIFRTYVDVIHFRVMKAGEIGSGSGKLSVDARKAKDVDRRSGFPTARIKEIEELSKRPDIYDALTRSLAPSIWELEDVKRGVLCMLFGGSSKRVKKRRSAEGDDDENNANGANISDSESSDDESEEEGEGHAAGSSGGTGRSFAKLNKRGDINILLCGDPGTSKSQLLGYVHKLAPRGVYTSGKGSSAVGLTASVVRDPETRELVLESGALVLSDQGICCIDEFDKMSDTTRAILHEAMEQQTVSIAKAGIICSLNARSSILASANPTESRYNPMMSVVDNIKLPPTLLSRFDLIYLILDQPAAESDRRLAKVGICICRVQRWERQFALFMTL